MTEDQRPLIDRERHRKQHDERKQEFTLHPDRAKIVSRAKVRIIQDYRKEAHCASFTFASDEHAPVGEGTAPSPLQYFVAAVGLWMLSQVTRFASVQDVALDKVEMELRATFPQEGKYGLDPAVGVAMEKLTYWIDIQSDAPVEKIVRLIETADGACHAANSLRVPVPVEGILRLNGAEVPFTPPVPPESRADRTAAAEPRSGSGAGPAGGSD